MVKPVRLQRKRIKGFKLISPNGLPVVYVGRPTKWGNPFVVGKSGGIYAAKVMNLRHAFQLFKSIAPQNDLLVKAARDELRGKNLCCWCPFPAPYEEDQCHAAVLIEIANSKEDL